MVEDNRGILIAHLDSHPEIDEGSRIGFRQIREGKFVRITKKPQIRRNISKEELGKLIGLDPEKIAKDIEEFSKKMKEEKYDPHPDKPFFG